MVFAFLLRAARRQLSKHSLTTAIRQAAQFIARISKLVQRIPLPELMPPATVGGARRLDDTAEICTLAKRWKNCLADCYLDAVNECRSAIYL